MVYSMSDHMHEVIYDAVLYSQKLQIKNTRSPENTDQGMDQTYCKCNYKVWCVDSLQSWLLLFCCLMEVHKGKYWRLIVVQSNGKNNR